jgi:hypothetical protein
MFIAFPFARQNALSGAKSLAPAYAGARDFASETGLEHVVRAADVATQD